MDINSGLVIDIGNGHGVIEIMRNLPPEVIERMYPQEYIEEMVGRLGKERASHLLSRSWRMVIFPNVAFHSDQNIRIIDPVSVDYTEFVQFHVKSTGAPDRAIQRSIRSHEDFYGPAGFGSPDDMEIFARIQHGVTANQEDWVRINRGFTMEKRGPSGERYGTNTSEVQTRSMYYAWKALMKDESHVTIPGRRSEVLVGPPSV